MSPALGTASAAGVSGRAHRHARERGVSAPLYASVRLLLRPVLRTWFHARIRGAEHIPREGPAVIACNHKSFVDALFIGIATRRPVRFMAKTELFWGPLGWLFVRLGAFPVRRGQTDLEAIQTAQLILEQGGVLVMFPEGTRVEDRRALGSPHHGAGRLALDSGTPLIPAAISGTHRLWIGPVPKPRRVQLTFLPAVDPGRLAGHPGAVDELIDEQLWPAVRQEYGRQLARPGLILGALAAMGIGIRLLARRQTQAPPRLLGVVEPRKARHRKARSQLAARFAPRPLVARLRKRLP